MAAAPAAAEGAAGGAAVAARRTVSELNKECRWRGLSTSGCVERADLERLLAEDDAQRAADRAAAAPTPAKAAASPAAPGAAGPTARGHQASPTPASQAPAEAAAARGQRAGPTLSEAQEELDSWVAYGPRALSLLRALRRLDVGVATLRETKVGLTVRRYEAHPDGAVAAAAREAVAAWRGIVRQAARDSGPPACAPPPARPKERALRRKRAAADDDDSDNAEGSGSSSSSGAAAAAAAPGAGLGQEGAAAGLAEQEGEEGAEGGEGGGPAGWSESKGTMTFRGKKQHFKVFTLRRPFGCPTWQVRLRVAQAQAQPECLELLQQMAVDFGAVPGRGAQARPEDEQTLQRLQRLEERFRGSGVTEGEARNAMRLFERELSKANWTEEKFLKLKRQLAGVEEWSAADVVSESSVQWTEVGKRRQAWFCDAGERIATPLGLEFGYTGNGGACFAGPLAAAAGASLTMLLVCRLATLDLQRVLRARGRSRVVRAQFLQGFVDGALEVQRHLVWQQLFSIEDDEEAARVCEQSLRTGFFDEGGAADAPGDAEGDIHELLRGLFAARRGSGAAGSGGPAGGAPEAFGPNPDLPPVYGAGQAPYEPFSGRGQRLSEEDGSGAPPAGGAAAAAGAAAGRDAWAITFATNLQVARSSRRRSREEARKVYHWTFSGQAVKATPTGTESYSKGHSAGQKRKGEIDGAAGMAKGKARKGARLALGQ